MTLEYVHSISPHDLAEQVNAKLAAGCTLHGPVIVHAYDLGQYVVRPAKEDSAAQAVEPVKE